MPVSPLEQPARVVIDPSVLVREIMTPAARPLCDAWREGAVVPVVTLKILNHTLGLLHGLSLPQELLERWALWLTHAEHCAVVRSTPPTPTIIAEYLQVVRLGHAAALLTDDAEVVRAAGAEGITTVSSHALGGSD